MPEFDNPRVGEVVIYHAYGTPGGEFPAGANRAAIVTEAKHYERGEIGYLNRLISLCVLNPTGLFFNQDVPYGRGPGQWQHLYEIHE